MSCECPRLTLTVQDVTVGYCAEHVSGAAMLEALRRWSRWAIIRVR